MVPRKGTGVGMIIALMGAVIIPVIVVILMMARPDPQTYRYSIAAGTQEAIAKGVAVPDPLPSELRLKVGDTIEVTNKDVVTHTYTFLIVKPGETGRYTFHNAGNFTAECSVGAHTDVSIIVDP